MAAGILYTAIGHHILYAVALLPTVLRKSDLSMLMQDEYGLITSLFINRVVHGGTKYNRHLSPMNLGPVDRDMTVVDCFKTLDYILIINIF